ncbi:MAG TPA: RidA family protein [Vicinamibacterales bacterium]
MGIDRTNPPALSKPGGHYTHVVVHNGVAYVSGQLPIGENGPLPGTASFEEQARQVLRNVAAALEGVGSDLSRVLKCTVYISNVGDWTEFNRLYAEAFGDHAPARTVVPVSPLHYGFRVEMDAIAAAD